MKTIDELHRLETELSKAKLPREMKEWGGADVVISRRHPPKMTQQGFYPEPRYVVTDYALELSWLFVALRDAFYAEERLDGCSKIEFFGRLANAANRYLTRTPNPTAHHLCAAVLHEGFAIYDEMEEKAFQCFPLAFGNEIVDDYVDEALRTGYIGTEKTIAFFREHGIEVNHD
jgi:hypothetical protein